MHTDSELSAFLKSNGLLLDSQLDLLIIDLLYEDLSIGRGKSNDILINIRTVSDNHAKIIYEDSRWSIEDLQSKNGISINGIRIDKITEMKEGDLVSIGGVEFEFGLNKPEISLRQDTILMNSALSHEFTEQLQPNQTMHVGNFKQPPEVSPSKNKHNKWPVVIVSILILIAISSFLVMKFVL